MLVFVCSLHQDQDKKRPLSSLSNLAITITDVQDMDPIFTNLPYSTNIEEDAPLVSNTPPLIPPFSTSPSPPPPFLLTCPKAPTQRTPPCR